MATYIVTTTEDVVDGSDGVLSLREAITAANASAEDDIITFSGVADGSVAVTASITDGALQIAPGGGQLTITGDVNDDGLGDVILSAGFHNHFKVLAGAMPRRSRSTRSFAKLITVVSRSTNFAREASVWNFG